MVMNIATRTFMTLVTCKEEVRQCRRPHEFLRNVVSLESASGVGLSKRLFDKPFSSMHLEFKRSQ